MPKRESEAASRALDAARSAARRSPSLRPRWCSCQRRSTSAPNVQAAREARHVSSSAARPRTWPPPSGGCALVSRRPASRSIRQAPGDGVLAGFPDRPRNDGKTGDVKRLRGEIDRLLLYTLGQKRITLDDVREVAGPAALQDDWAMTNAIEAGQTGDALRQLALILDAGAAPEKVLGQLGWLVRSKFPAIAPGGVAAGGRGAVPHGSRPEAIGRRSTRPARTAGRRVVCGEAVTRSPDGAGDGVDRSSGPGASRVVQARLVAAGRVPVNDRLCWPSCR